MFSALVMSNATNGAPIVGLAKLMVLDALARFGQLLIVLNQYRPLDEFWSVPGKKPRTASGAGTACAASGMVASSARPSDRQICRFCCCTDPRSVDLSQFYSTIRRTAGGSCVRRYRLIGSVPPRIHLT